MTPPFKMNQATSRATVLAYHAIGDCSADQDPHNLFVRQDVFANQMAYLATHRQVVSLESLLTGSARSRSPAIAITFDDGYRCFATRALPILSRFGFPATIFVPTKWIGQRNTWDPPSECELDIMSAEEIRQVVAVGMEIGSHGHAHIDMEAADPAAIACDVGKSMKIIEDLSQRRPRFLAYPYGRSSPEARRIVMEHGFVTAFSINEVGRGPYAYERVAITSLDGPRLFALKTSGHYIRLRNSRALSVGYSGIRRVLPERRRSK